MSTKVKGEAIKDGSIRYEALDKGLSFVPALTEFVKKLQKEDVNTSIEIPYASQLHIFIGSQNKIIRIVTDQSYTIENYGDSVTLSVSQSGSSLTLNISNMKNPSFIEGFNIYIYKNLNKIRTEFLPTIETPTPDWNAQEGEAGYIENRTHFAKYIPIPKDASVGIDVSYTYDYDRDVHYLLKDIVVEYKYSDETIYNKVIIPAGTDINGSVYVETEREGVSETFEFSLTYDYGDVNIRIIKGGGYNFRVVIYNILDDNYLPNTVIQTTPQILPDTDKNQVLANLGIADLLEALKPVELLSDSEFPTGDNVSQEDLDYIGLTRTVIDNIINGITTKVNYNGTLSDVIGVYKWNTGFKFSLIFIEDPQIIETETGITSTFFSASSYNVKYNGTNYKCSMSGF